MEALIAKALGKLEREDDIPFKWFDLGKKNAAGYGW